jgi:hypothetical protein
MRDRVTFPHKNVRLALIVAASLCCFIISPGSYAQTLDRLVEIDFDPVPNAKQYEVRATSTSDPKIKPRSYNIKNTAFSERLPLGSWVVEVRSYDRRGVAGRWTKLGDVTIGFKAPVPLSPAANSTIKTTPDKPVSVTFQWESFSPDASYKLVIKAPDLDKPIVEQDVKGGRFSYDLTQGPYTWSITSSPPPGAPLDGTDPAPGHFMVNAGKLADPAIDKFKTSPPSSISWKSVPNAGRYSLTLEKTKDQDGKDLASPERLVTKDTLETTEAMPKTFDPGTYRFSVTARSKGFDDSRQRTIQFRVRRPKDDNNTIAKTAATKKDDKPKVERPRHAPVNFLQGTMGPVFWQYNFSSTNGQKFDLMAATVTAVAADVNSWFAVTPTSAWAMEIRGRQTNIYLFENGNPEVPTQTKVTVADRRLALIARKRRIIDRVGIDAIFGFGSHHYTYLVQNESNAVITPMEGDLFEVYLGGALDWQTKDGSHATFDLTFHPVGSSIGISADKTWQYTATARYLKNMIYERTYLSLSLENFRSRINTHSKSFSGEAETISTWYRAGIGLAITL